MRYDNLLKYKYMFLVLCVYQHYDTCILLYEFVVQAENALYQKMKTICVQIDYWRIAICSMIVARCILSRGRDPYLSN